jgi:hypothetical protein
VHAAVACQLLKERRPRLIINEAVRVERPHIGERRVFSPSENQAQPRIGCERRCAVELNKADIQAFMQTVEQAGERATRQAR